MVNIQDEPPLGWLAERVNTINNQIKKYNEGWADPPLENKHICVKCGNFGLNAYNPSDGLCIICHEIDTCSGSPDEIKYIINSREDAYKDLELANSKIENIKTILLSDLFSPELKLIGIAAVVEGKYVLTPADTTLPLSHQSNHQVSRAHQKIRDRANTVED